MEQYAISNISNQYKVKSGWGVLDRLIVIECVLWGLIFNLHVECHDWILTKLLFKELATFIRSEGVADSAYKVN